MVEQGLDMAKKTHSRGFSFNPSPKSIVKSQDSKSIVKSQVNGLKQDDIQFEGGDAYAQLEQTTQNNIQDNTNDFSKVEGSIERKSKSVGAVISESPRNDTQRALVQGKDDSQMITHNVVKKYNR